MDMSRDGEPLESIDEDAVKNFHRNILTERNPAVRYAGEEFDLTPENVLKIPGPQDEMRGPHRVVHIQNTEDRWALVTLEWWIDDLEAWKPCLGLRWFHGNSGYPVAARGWARWMVIPSELSRGILDTLPLYPQDRAEIDAFLAAEWAEE